ncbi:uroporphyrinogen decarboxylase [Lignipirellula cremea]|uniref:Uroporphyrinogen decarboxylase n=1 Tax=Lignipirellula cremea TaxID=2528010 RepID=A0A518DR75_9BACT|nr:uroporphyrinogen decarboxylase [Lignipirellula cremea]QDU94324.1 Uroporphyrinogen decarboxylase [Lignipirellula cremea]
MNKNGNFNGLRVAAFESRRADDLTRLIERSGGVPFVSPSMREAPLENQSAAIEFAQEILTGQIDVVIFLTGVGFHQMLAAIEKSIDRQRYLDALSDIVTIARGPKPAFAMSEVGLSPTFRVPEPNTWREVLNLIDTQLPIANQSVGIQEYGKTNPSLLAGLEARGARVSNVRIYSWELPDDCGPLEANVRRLAAGEIDVALFTSAHQLTNLFESADKLGLREETHRGLRQAVIASIGPTTSEALRDFDLPIDLEPEHPKMGPLVAAAASRAAELRQRKLQVSTMFSGPASHSSDENASWYDSPFMKACRREPTDVTPVWLMRQAGRYMAEYREVRAKTSFLELCKNPQLCSEVMCTAVARLGVDAAIIFSDLLPILEPMGLDLEFVQGDGPVIHNPLREAIDVDRVRELEAIDELQYVVETVSRTRADLPEDIPLIGFAGSPFTLASYAIEGGSSRQYLNTKILMLTDEGAWSELMSKLARAVTLYLNAQIAAGAQCVQLFDSWVGCLGPDDYRRYVLPYIQQIVENLTPGTPVINFATGNPALLPLLAESGAAVVGVDWRIRLDDAWKTIGHDRAVQGNMEPSVLLTNPAEIRRRAGEVLDQAGGRPGHIFNLGHGVHQQTPVDNAIALVDAVHELSSR